MRFNDDGTVAKAYTGPGRDGESYAEGPGDIVKGISGEAVRILKRPGSFFSLSPDPCTLMCLFSQRPQDSQTGSSAPV